MIIKITREYDKWSNLSKEYFAEKKEFEFEHRDTKKEHGALLVMMSGLKARDLAPAWLERTEANMTSLNSK